MNDDDIELGNYGRILRRSWWVLAIGAIVGVLLAIFLLPSSSSFYQSNVSVLLVPGDSDLQQGNDLINEDTEIGIAVSQVIGDRVVSQVDDLTLDEWSEGLFVSACLNAENIITNDSCSSQILEFSFQAGSPEQAEEVVLVTAETYIEFRRDREQALRSESIANLEAEVEELDTRGATERAAFLVAEEDSLEAELIERRLRDIEDTKLTVVSQLTDLRSRSSEVGSLLGAPSVPEAGSTGIPFLFAVLAGILVGLMLGAVVAIALDRLDRRVAGADELEADLGVPILGDIPRITQDSPALVTAVSAHTPGAEAFRRVAAAVLAQRSGAGAEVNSIAIVGANDGEGRTTTTINLALAIAQTGREVLVVNIDRRNPVIDRIFGMVGEPGLNDFLRSKADIAAAHQAIENASQRVGIRLFATGTGADVSVSSSALKALIAAAKERNMVVVFDTPPALTHAGGLQIAAEVDSVLAVAAAGRSRRSELDELRTQLDNVSAYVAGAVFNRTSRLSLLPAGYGDIATVSIPNGVPGNAANGSRNPFVSNNLNGQPAPQQTQFAAQAPAPAGYDPAEAAAVNGTVAPTSGIPTAVNGHGVTPQATSTESSISTGVPNEPAQDYSLPQHQSAQPQQAGTEVAGANAAQATPGYVTQPVPGEAQPAVDKFASMQGLFRSEPDGES